jgi:cold shock CspA family protein
MGYVIRAPFSTQDRLKIAGVNNDFKVGDKVDLRVLDVPEHVYGFHVDGNRNIRSKSRCYSGFSTSVRIKKTNPPPAVDRESGILHTEQTENHIRFLEMDTEKAGRMRVWEISLISRNGAFFLTQQLVYDFAVYRQLGNGSSWDLTSRRFGRNAPQEWPSLMGFCEEALKEAEKWNFIPNRPREPNHDMLEPSQHGFTAVVDWFNVRVGLGALQVTPATQARVHFSDIETSRQIPYLESGERVHYDRLEKPVEDGKDTAFSWQAHEVTPSEE